MTLQLLFWGTTAVIWTTIIANECQLTPECSSENKICDIISFNCSGRHIPIISKNDFPPFINMKTIRTFNINDGDLSKIEYDFFLDKDNLEYLNLSKNLLASLDSEILSPLKNLISLDLSHNLLTYISPRLFSAQTELQTLILSYNKLTTLNESALFSELLHLLRLDLSHNRIAFLTQDLFAPLTKLEDLELTGNKITRLDVSQLRTLLSLKKFYLRGNAFLCNCEIHRIIQILKNVSEVEATCKNTTTWYEINWFHADFDTICKQLEATTIKLPSDLLETENEASWSWDDIKKDIIIYVLSSFIVIFVLVLILWKIKVCYQKGLFSPRRLSTTYDDVLPQHEYYYEEVGGPVRGTTQVNLSSLPVTSNIPPARPPLSPSTDRSQKRVHVTVQSEDVGSDRISNINGYDYVTQGETMSRNGDSAYIVPP